MKTGCRIAAGVFESTDAAAKQAQTALRCTKKTRWPSTYSAQRLMKPFPQLLVSAISVFGSLGRNRWAATPMLGGILGIWLVVPWAYADVTITTLVSFDGTNGSEPWGGLVQGDNGILYGTTSFGGVYNAGTVFSISPTGTLATLRSFKLDADGAIPQAGLAMGNDGLLYGTTREAPPYRGSVFKMTTNGILTTLTRFSGTNGSSPWNGTLIEGSGGGVFGMTANGGNTNTSSSGYGTAFKTTSNGLFTNLHSFDFATGGTPYGGLVEGFDGNFYGTTSRGGGLSGGTVFKLTPSGLHTILAAFSFLGTNGLNPFSALLPGRDGGFYGTTTQGGTSYGAPGSVNGQGFGTVFRITASGKFTSLFSFQGTNGAYPYASLTEGVDGNFYGVTASGGAFTNQLFPGSGGHAGYGTVFRITPNGVFTSLASFAGTNGADVLGNLTLGKDGHFYGTTLMGGAYGLGTVFRLDMDPLPAVASPVVSSGLATNGFALTIKGPANSRWTINCSTNLPPQWFALMDCKIPSSPPVVRFVDFGATNSQRFYEVVPRSD